MGKRGVTINLGHPVRIIPGEGKQAGKFEVWLRRKFLGAKVSECIHVRFLCTPHESFTVRDEDVLELADTLRDAYKLIHPYEETDA